MCVCVHIKNLGTHLREGIETASGLEMTSLFGRIRISLRFGFHTAKKTRRVKLKSKPNKEVSVEPFFFRILGPVSGPECSPQGDSGWRCRRSLRSRGLQMAIYGRSDGLKPWDFGVPDVQNPNGDRSKPMIFHMTRGD